MSQQQPNSEQQEPEDWRTRRRQWRHQGGFQGLFWGLLLILIGVLFYGQYAGWLNGEKWWQYFLVGLGAIFIIEAIFRFFSHRWGAVGRLVIGVILVSIGIFFLFGINQWWPLILIVVGIIILLASLFRKGK